MNKYLIVVLSTFFLIVLSGCSTTHNVYGLSSDSLSGTINSNDPSLSIPKKGFHPYVSASYSDKQGIGSIRESNETFHSESITTGCYYQPSLEEQNVFKSFYNLCLSGNSITYKPRVTQDQSKEISLNNINCDNSFTDFSLALVGKPGFLVKRTNRLLSAYLIGLIQYENGDYSRFRKKVDQIDLLYNLSSNNFSFGFGYGVNAQYGRIGKCDLGISFEETSLFNRTQSVSYSYITNDSDVVLSDDGDTYRKTVFKIEPYIDYKHIRFSTSFNSSEKISYQVTYRF